MAPVMASHLPPNELLKQGFGITPLLQSQLTLLQRSIHHQQIRTSCKCASLRRVQGLANSNNPYNDKTTCSHPGRR